MARTATISPNPASRVWRGRFGRRLPSIRAMPAKCRPPRVSSAAEGVGYEAPCNDVERYGAGMPVYTVHAPARQNLGGGPTSIAAADKFVFVRDGFHVWAFVFGPLWLLFHRLWLALLGYLVVAI